MSENTTCAECGMWNPPAFHPYAACLMFNAGADSKLIAAVMEQFSGFIATERAAREAAELEVGRLHMQLEESKAYGLRQAMERLTERKNADEAEAQAARLVEAVKKLAVEIESNLADEVSEADIAYNHAMKSCAMYVRGLVGGEGVAGG